MHAALLALLPVLALATPVDKRWTASPDVGSTTTDLFPPTGTKVNSALFPGETAIGYPGVTLTGVEPAAIQTAPAYPYSDEAASEFPLVADQPEGGSNFDVFKYWGNLSPWYSVPSSYYGLGDASPLTPEGCSITQILLLYRHGARYPTSGALPSSFAAKLHTAAVNSTWSSWGELDFLNTWTYKLGAELLTPFGRLQNFELGVEMRQQYGYLLNNFTSTDTLPVFRTESQDRMVKTAENFAAGFFGVPEYLDQAPYEVCTNSNVASRGSIGSTLATAFAVNAFNSTLDRLNSQVSGISFTPNDIVSMLQLCSYETDALGYSAFCKIFTQEDFENYEYYYDLSFYYNNGYGSPVAAAQGKGYLEEWVSRFTQTPITKWDAANNRTLDSNSTYFPLNQSIYADATHEVVVLDTLTAFNLPSLFSTGALPTKQRTNSSFKASQVVPFGTHFLTQVMECPAMTPTKQIRFLVNDAVLPIDKSYAGCSYNKDGLCSFDNVVSVLQKRTHEIDFNYDCFANYTATPGVDYNGRAPRNAQWKQCEGPRRARHGEKMMESS